MLKVLWFLPPPHVWVTHRRQKELEEKLIEEEVAKRVEELVAQRVEEELEKRKDEIEQEVLRRVEEAKRIMEKQMLEEMERQRQVEMEAQKKKEVKNDTNVQRRAVMAWLKSRRRYCLITFVFYKLISRIVFRSKIINSSFYLFILIMIWQPCLY